ncbi:lysylphosphatidylglycerol synthase transmembrane domain-containing protein [Lunatibacter salilacus]|uniref:lysylphosphatidylglycerol synthase transmembrane domain-containing protein n=1 Tax=Lunatibacter salilacus TaxID=2483804 RepID=UPI00131BA962|nr:lysylphosphatidylglycerol synthase transmembrane domain-containing protein [Lunatibacter salilacus]
MNSKALKLALKIILTVGALYLVFSKIEVDTTWRVIRNSHLGWLALALVLYVASKVFCSYRLNGYFRNIGIFLKDKEHLRLYAIGMFYNLFLPGGIGGDGYKVYLLRKTHQISAKKLIRAVVLDRGNGLAVLLFLMFALAIFMHVDWPLPINITWIGIIGLILILPGFYLVMILFFKDFLGSLLPTTGFSFLNQVLQVISAYFILLALGVTDHFIAYLFVFLVSSVVSVLPLTIGGVGARELVFVYAYEYVAIDKNTAVAFSLMFFVFTALTSLSGVFVKFEPNR